MNIRNTFIHFICVCQNFKSISYEFFVEEESIVTLER